MRALNGQGQTLWVFPTNEVVQSSPAVGELNGQLDVVVGTGDYYATAGHSWATDSTMLFALDAAGGQLVWERNLGGYTRSSPALADLYGNGQLDVVEATSLPLGQAEPASQTEVWALSGSGQPLPGWPVTTPAGGVYGSVVTADLQGNGTQDVLVPTTQGLYVYDPAGQLIAQFGTGQSPWDCPVSLPIGLQNSPLLTRGPNGSIGLTLAGYNAFGGLILHYGITSPSSIGVESWPQFRQNPQLTGTVPTAPPASTILRDPGAKGYWTVSVTGQVSGSAGVPVYGSSPGAISAFERIVSMASAPNGNGYWILSSNGSVFGFGNAPSAGVLIRR